jgi:sortase A
VAGKQSTENLSIDELRHLLVEKRRMARQDRLDHFRRTGRVIVVSPEPVNSTLETLRTDSPAAGVETSSKEEQEEKRSRRHLIFDRLLLLVEIAAVIGLGLVLVNSVSILRNLNKEVISALVLPTLTPTPIISAVVLPSGHTPPNSPGGSQPNQAEIPEHLRPLVQSLANLPVPTASPEQAVRIQIPSIKVDAPVVMGDGWEQLKKGVAQHIGTPNPGQKGNLVLSAHNDVFGEIFRNLDTLKVGDQVILYTTTGQRPYVYIVTNSQIVLPTQVEVMAPTEKATLTLVSCYPYMVDNRRIVISAELSSSS